MKLGVDPELVELLLNVVRKHKVHCVGSKINGVIILHIFRENILVLQSNMSWTILDESQYNRNTKNLSVLMSKKDPNRATRPGDRNGR